MLVPVLVAVVVSLPLTPGPSLAWGASGAGPLASLLVAGMSAGILHSPPEHRYPLGQGFGPLAQAWVPLGG